MLPSLTVPKPPRRPTKELRFAHSWPTPGEGVGSSNPSDCSICQIADSEPPSFSSPRKPIYEFCESTAQRCAWSFAVAAVGCGTRFDGAKPGPVAPEDLNDRNSGYSLP